MAATLTCPLDSGWQVLVAFPEGFTGNGGVATGQCSFLVVGELVDRGTATQKAVVLSADSAIATVTSEHEARTLWDISREDDGTMWAAGERADGTGLLIREQADGWQEVSVPGDIGWINRVAWTGVNLLTLSVMSEQGVLSSFSPEDGWVELATIRSHLVEGRPRPEVPGFRAMATNGDDIAVVGTDGYRGVLLVSTDRGRTFDLDMLPEDSFTVATTALWTSSGLVVAGYRTSGIEVYEGALLLRDEGEWRELALPEGVGRIRDGLAGDSIYLIAEVEDGDRVLAIRGDTVEAEELRGAGLARFIAPAESSLTVIGGDLYRRSIP